MGTSTPTKRKTRSKSSPPAPHAPQKKQKSSSESPAARSASYEATVAAARARDARVVVIECRCGASGLAKAKELREHVFEEFGEKASAGAGGDGVAVLLNPRYLAPRPGSFVVAVGSSTLFDLTGLAKPYDAVADLAMADLVAATLARLDACRGA